MEQKFSTVMFLAVTAIAFIFFASIYAVSTTGDFGAWDKIFKPRSGMCFCHNGVGTYKVANAQGGFGTDCMTGIQGYGTQKIGIKTKNQCIDTCGPVNYWWCCIG